MKKSLTKTMFLCATMVFMAGCGAFHYVMVPDSEPYEYHTAKTQDGWTLALYRYRPKLAAPLKFPVILCHGLGMNGTLWDLKRDKSFARYLREQGFDVWVVDLRGAGQSSKPGWVILHDLVSGPDMTPKRFENASFRFEHSNWDMDSYVTQDIPAIVQEVKKVTGAPQVHWVGHSMGGMIMFAHMIRTQDPSIRTLVAIATPMDMPRPHTDLLNTLEQGSNLRQLAYLINAKVTARSFSVWGLFGGTPFDSSMYNRENMENHTIVRLLDSAMEDLSPGVADGFIQFIKTGEYVSSDNSIDYTKQQTTIKLPLLLVGGWEDPMCVAVCLYDTYRAVGSKDKTLRIFGRANGNRANYGHNDLIVGRNAPLEVYPFVSQWLKDRS